ncbi:RemN protein [Burkholderia pseudomallei]|uniref:RemN protein n=1 Tax=Burkholderia pseudomallei (strain 1106a) TaxID=357348 RepID=A3P1Y5_BURP0|nr:RemN protein [Burkholderia pseudomallei 1106a]ANW52432.1 RemN protein [Burkholderia pseudomallei]AOP69718.1 RemN protein [Burkholderia mallei]EES23234.1 RemN protein [Burkholderia pseudomallei 1106b]ANW58417.1 RemN protein [Burkholderia pseudomallei]
MVSAYMTAFAACLLPAGGLADRAGRKRVLLAGLAVFFVASLGCGLAPSAALLNVARAVKGIGAAMLLTSALAVIANRFSEGRERARGRSGACAWASRRRSRRSSAARSRNGSGGAGSSC